MNKHTYKINGNVYDVVISSIEDRHAKVEVNGLTYEVEILTKATPTKLAPLTPPSSGGFIPTPPAASPRRGTKGSISSPLPGVILEISVAKGDVVKRGQKIAVLEAMKMENVINAEADGTVVEVKVAAGDSIMEGADIVVIE